MATPLTLVARGVLVQIVPPLGPGDGCAIRQMFGLPLIRDWMRDTVPTMGSEDGAQMSPAEELDDLLFNYFSDQGRLLYRRTIKDLQPAGEEIWELKTWQLRIFGWFYKKDCFIAALPVRAVDVKRATDGYRNARRRVVNARDALSLDEPKYVGGVISNVVSI